MWYWLISMYMIHTPNIKQFKSLSYTFYIAVPIVEFKRFLQHGEDEIVFYFVPLKQLTAHYLYKSALLSLLGKQNGHIFQ